MMTSRKDHKILLSESEMPTQWYNIVPDLPSPPPPALHPGTKEPAGPADFEPLFPLALILQEVSMDRYIDIPDEVLDIYRLWRPSPLYRAHRLEKALDTPARIYYKYEGVSPAGSHKPNTAVAQAYYNKQEGVKKLTTETGAGQWGTALAFACALFDMECEVWQVRSSYDQKPYRKALIETFGGGHPPEPQRPHRSWTRHPRRPIPAPPARWASRSAKRSRWRPRTPRSGTHSVRCSTTSCSIRRSSARRRCCSWPRSKRRPTSWSVVSGGGSNFAGLSFPFMREKMAGTMSPRILAVEPAACPSLTKGLYAYDFGDTAGMTPLMKMHTLGHDFVPDPDPCRWTSVSRHVAAGESHL